jgi:hypothetical protein
MLKLFILLALSVDSLAAAQEATRTEAHDDSLVHGTINVAMANGNGIVVLTDSMLSGQNGRPLRDQPAQKLFKLDDRTVCAFAGFYAARANIPELYTNTNSIIHEYVKQSATQPPLTIAEKVRALAQLFNVYLSTIANVRSASGISTPLGSYEFQLIVAGYDTDDKPKIGRLVLKSNRQSGFISSETNELSVENIGETLVWKLNGIDDTALRLLGHPDLKSNEVALRQYAAAMRQNQGRALTIQQMTKVAERLEYYTSKDYPWVGGATQTAVLQKGHVVSVQQRSFPEPPKPLLHFQLRVNYSKIGYFSLSRQEYTGLSIVCVKCEFKDTIDDIDGYYFIGSTLTNCRLRYDDGPVNLSDSKIVNTVLLVGKNAKRATEMVRHLIGDFPWLRVSYEH